MNSNYPAAGNPDADGPDANDPGAYRPLPDGLPAQYGSGQANSYPEPMQEPNGSLSPSPLGYTPQSAHPQTGYGVAPSYSDAAPAPYGQPYAAPNSGYQPLGYDPVTGEPLSDKSKVAAGLLQLFLGGFGIGRFYIGSNTIGAIQLGLTVLGWLTLIFGIGLLILVGVGIWAFVDAIMMFTGSVADSQGRKLRP